MADAVLTLRSCPSIRALKKEPASLHCDETDRGKQELSCDKTASPPTLHQLYFLSCREDFPMLGLNGLMNFEAFLSV